MNRLRLKCLCVLLAFSLAACGSEPTSESTLGSAIGGLIKGQSSTSAKTTVEKIRRNITPAVRKRFGNKPLIIGFLEQRNAASLLIEEQTNKGVATYTTPDRITVSLRDGVLVATRGLGFDLMSADVDDVVPSLRSGKQAVRVHRYLNGEDQIVIRSFICDYAGHATVTETCYGDGLTVQNSYVYGNGQVVKSRQWISPQQGYIRLEQAG